MPASHCYIVYADGKTDIVDALRTPVLSGISGIAGIVDADYWLITEADELGTENLLYDDCCPDMELLLLCSPALKKVLRNNLYNYDVDKMHEFAEKLIDVAQGLAVEFGYFRLLNHERDCGLRVNAIRFDEVIDSVTLALNRALVASKLTGDKPGIVGEDLLQQVDELREQYPADKSQLCRGKDVVEILAYLLPLRFKAEFGEDFPQRLTAVFEGRALANGLRSAYDSAYFKETSLHSRIRNWECANEPYRILKADI